MKTTAVRFFTLFGFFAVGFGWVMSMSQPQPIARDPAALRTSFDYSHLKGDSLEKAMRQRLVAGLQIVNEGDRIGFSVGHFTFVNERGQKALACREFEKMKFVFEAEGIVVNGERPEMQLEGNCHFAGDVGRVNPLFLPVARILGERPADGEFEFRDEDPVSVRFANLSDEWPRKWILTEVSLGADKKNQIRIQRNELKKLLGQPLMVTIGE